MKTTIFLCVLSISTLCKAQDGGQLTGTVKSTRLLIQATCFYNINRNTGREHYFSMVTPGNGVKKGFKANNTFGYQAGISYEFRNRRRFTFSPGIVYGIQNISYDNYLSYTHVDPGNLPAGAGHLYNVRTVSRYISPLFALGKDYSLEAGSRLALQTKVGIGSLFFLKDLYSRVAHQVLYKQNSNGFRAVTFAESELWRQRSPIGSPYYNFYFGLVRKTGSSLIKEYRAGVSFSHAFGLFTGDSDFIGSFNNQYFGKDGNIMGEEIFYDRFRNIGLTVAVGF